MRLGSKYRRYKLTARKDIEVVVNGMPKKIQHGVILEFVQGGGMAPWEKQKCMESFKFKGTTQEADEATPVDPSSRLSVFDMDWPGVQEQWAGFERLEQQEREVRAKHEPGLDTKPGWLRREVEEFVRNYHTHGRDYIILVADPVPAPWPTYDELTIHGQRKAEVVARRNIEIAHATGIPLDALLAYESQNRNDARIISAYEAAKHEVVPEAAPDVELVEA